jgi:hypothetical protein
VTREELDAAVLHALQRFADPSSAGVIAAHAGASLMATVYSLRRLCDAGHAEKHTEIVDTPSRTGSTVVMYRATSIPHITEWPQWLAPCNLPPIRASMRVERE